MMQLMGKHHRGPVTLLFDTVSRENGYTRVVVRWYSSWLNSKAALVFGRTLRTLAPVYSSSPAASPH